MARRNNGPRIRWFPKRGVYYIVWSENGRSKERTTGTANRVVAEEALADFIHDRRREPGQQRRPSEVLITDVLEAYLREGELKPNSAERAAYAVVALTSFWKGKSVQEVSKTSCKEYSSFRNRTIGTVRKELGVLRAAINQAAASQWLRHAVKVFVPRQPKGRERWLTRKEAAALLRAALRLPKARSYLSLFIVIGLHSGQRKQSILGLRWEQVDLRQKRIDWGEAETEDSNKKRPLTRIPSKLLPHLRREFRRRGRNEFVIQIDGRRLGDIKSSFNSACERAGLKRVIPHTLRHTRATWGMQAGADKWQLAGFLGMTLETLERVYGHHHPDFQAEGADQYRGKASSKDGEDDDEWE